MPRKTPKTPSTLKDDDLDQASGGIGMLLPAVQKVRQAASRSATTSDSASPTTVLQTKSGDGSV